MKQKKTASKKAPSVPMLSLTVSGVYDCSNGDTLVVCAGESEAIEIAGLEFAGSRRYYKLWLTGDVEVTEVDTLELPIDASGMINCKVR